MQENDRLDSLMMEIYAGNCLQLLQNDMRVLKKHTKSPVVIGRTYKILLFYLASGFPAVELVLMEECHLPSNCHVGKFKFTLEHNK